MGSPARSSSKYFAGLAFGALLASSFAASCSDNDHPIEVGGNAGTSRSGTGGDAGSVDEGGSPSHGGKPSSGGAGSKAGASSGGQPDGPGGSGGDALGGTSGSSGTGGATSGSGGTSGSSGSGGKSGGGGTSGSGGASGGSGTGGNGGKSGSAGTSGGGSTSAGTSGGGSTSAGTSGGGSTSAGTSGGGSTSAGSSGVSGGDVSGDGGTAGSSGTGGNPGFLTCPSQLCSTPYSVENCGPTCNPITTPQCLACEATNFCDGNPCSALTSNAQAGSAVGTGRAALCNEALSCLRVTGCSVLPDGSTPQDVVNSCYCGTVGFANCLPANANGPCKGAFERSFETADKTVMTGRILDTTYGGSQAWYRVDCGSFFCPNAGCVSTPP